MTQLSKDIESVILFGSYSTGLANTDSDIDVCVIRKSELSEKLDHEEITNLLPFKIEGFLNITSYDDDTVSKMLEYGSLFLWHLKLEGIVLYGDDYFQNRIIKLKTFDKHLEEIAYHRDLFSDLVSSQIVLQKYTYFDMSTLFTISRNSCMILSHKLENPKFSKLEPFEYVKSVFPDLPMTYETYNILSKFKIQYERDSKEKNIVELKDYAPSFFYSAVDQLLDFSYDKIK